MAKRFLTFAVDRRATSWQVMLPTAIAFFVFGFVSGAIAAALLWLLLAVAHRTVLRAAVAQCHPLIGVIVTFVLTALASWGADTVTGEELSVGGWFARAAFVMLMTAVWSSLGDYRRGLAEERALQAALVATRAAGAHRVQEQRDDVVRRVAEMLDETLDDIDNTLAASGHLRSLARERIRPLSHELAKALPAYEPIRAAAPVDAPWRTVAMNVLGVPVIRPFAMAVLVTFMFVLATTTIVSGSPDVVTTGVDQPISSTGLEVSVDLAGMLWSLFFLALVFVSTWLVGIIAVRSTRRLLPTLSLVGRVAAVLLDVLLMAFVVQVVVELAYIAPGTTTEVDHVADRLLVGLPIFIVAFLMLLVRTVAELFTSVQRREQDLTAELAWESARAHETLAQERQFLATAIHGPLQSTVAAAAMGLEEARRLGEDPAQAWTKAEAQLVAAVRALADGPPERRDLAREMAAMTTTWAGLCEVEIDIQESLRAVLSQDWVSAGTVSDLLSEAIANAVMHGQATRVRISVAAGEGSTMRMVVINDGHAPEPDADQGLGSRQLNEMSISWWREASDDQTRLEVVLPAPW